MNQNLAMRMFDMVYPEKKIKKKMREIDNTHYLVEAIFPDEPGQTFYFIVTHNSVSQSFNSEEDALKTLQ